MSQKTATALYQVLPGAKTAKMELTMCTTYVETQLQDVFCFDGKPRYFLENSQSCKSFLSINDARMEFTVEGTADMTIVDAQAHKIRDWAVGLCFIIEIKKDLVDNFEDYFRQSLLKLIAADFKSEKHRAPVGLLTDLNNAWYFIWFTAEKEIATLLLEYPANDFQFIRDILAADPGPSEGDIYLTKSCFVTNPDDLRRRLDDLLPPVVTSTSESLMKFEEISEYLSPEFMRKQRLLYWAHEITRKMAVEE
ncbi:hypothetical protein PI124_g18156 [Phytophthora idaei]|nr:hypothetical protein PI125_g19174 [Phytophthora idaei]KAG3137121.1 hypothetical protein PI126_g17525 [Phytophthora idaei]KAG3236842.1 hypothetical protein PI124_g18156 [Phytophthora idaei]